MSNMKKVSIIVPLYKSEAFMKQLVDSILDQTYKNLELILVDDESPDKSGDIADEYAMRDERVKVIHKKNGGCCDARNKGLEIITGDYLMFADGDDWMELDCVEYLVNLLETNQCEMAMTDSIFTTFDTKQNVSDNIRIWTPEQATCGIIYVDIPIGPWNKIYTVSSIKKHNLSFSVPWFGEGLYFSVMAAQFSKKIAVGHKRVYHYRLDNPNSGTTLKEVKNGINSLNNIRYIKKCLVVKTPATLAACDLHTLKNCYTLIVFIIGSGQEEKFSDLLKETVKEYRKLYPIVMKTSRMYLKQRIRYTLINISPIFFAKYGICKKKYL